MGCGGTADVRRNCLNAARLEFMSQHSDFGLVAVANRESAMEDVNDLGGGGGNELLLDLDLSLFQLENLLTDHLHFLELSGHCVICQLDNISANVATHGAAVIER
jgi:hypothetical protein